MARALPLTPVTETSGLSRFGEAFFSISHPSAESQLLSARRDSNPRPSGPYQGFSVRSLLCFSQPRRSRKQDADRLSHCLLSRLAPRPGQTVIPLADARIRVEGIPGLTDLRLSLRQRKRGQCALRWHLLVCGHRINEVTTATLGTLPLARPPKSKIPCTGIQSEDSL